MHLDIPTTCVKPNPHVTTVSRDNMNTCIQGFNEMKHLGFLNQSRYCQNLKREETLVVIFSAPMPKSPGDLVVRASDWYSEDPGSIPS